MKITRKSTRERIVDAGLYLFWLQGYAATGHGRDFGPRGG